MNMTKMTGRLTFALGMLALGAGCRADNADASDQQAVATAEGAGQQVVAVPASAELPPQASGDTATLIKVYKDANCGCCNKWVEHLASNGFKVETMDMPDLSLLKQKHGVAEKLQSCHTAIVDGYVVEGHVPAEVIRKMLRERPSIAGLAVPGMPMGSPGMEGPTKERYDVLTFDRAGRTTVYSQQ